MKVATNIQQQQLKRQQKKEEELKEDKLELIIKRIEAVSLKTVNASGIMYEASDDKKCLVPAAAVIPAPKAHIKVAAVKKLVAGHKTWACSTPRGVQLLIPPLPGSEFP